MEKKKFCYLCGREDSILIEVAIYDESKRQNVIVWVCECNKNSISCEN